MHPETPTEIASALEQLVQDLRAQAGANFAGLVVYGGLARGRYRPGRSDVNVIVLLNNPDGKALKGIAPALRDARRLAGIDAMLLSPTEVDSAARDFPSKYLDIQKHHVVLYGSDPFDAVKISLSDVQKRVAQSLRNQLIRLRHCYLVRCSEPDGLRAALLGAARSLAIDLSCLLIAEGHPPPDDDRTATVYQIASGVFNLDASTLGDLAALRNGANLANPDDLFVRLLSVLSSLADRADGIARTS